MDLPAILLVSLWSGLWAFALAILYTAPPSQLLATFLCGFLGRTTRDLCIAWDLGYNWGTMAGAVVVVLVAALLLRRREVSPVVLVCGVLPLGAAIAMFKLIVSLMRVSVVEGEALREATLTLVANLGKAFTGSLAIAVGLVVGTTLVGALSKRSLATA